MPVDGCPVGVTWNTAPRLTEVLGMLHIYGHGFHLIITRLYETMLRATRHKDQPILGSDAEEINAVLVNLDAACEKLGLAFTRAQIERIRQPRPRPSTGYDMAGLLGELQARIHDELKGRLLLHVDVSKAPFYNDAGFDPAMLSRFPSTTFDATEAGRCYALERNTACAFHLMRVMEVGLNALARELDVPISLPTWDAKLKKIDAALAGRDWSDETADKRTFLNEAAGQWHAVKNAWRNPTMHIEKKYSDEEALEIFNAVKGFMRHLALRLSESQEAD